MRDRAFNEVKAAYQRYLGRIPSAEEIWSHFGDDFSDATIARAVNFIASSPEATEYRTAQQNPPSGTTPPPTTPPAPGRVDSDPFETRPTAGDFGRVEGADSRNWGSMNSVKYRLLELAARYPHTPSGLDQLFQDPDFRRTFPNARILDRNSGVIDVGGTLSDFNRGVPVTRVDIGRAFSAADDSGGAWVWQDLVNTGEAGPASPGASSDWRYRPTTPTTPTTPPPGTPPGAPPSGPGTGEPPPPPDTTLAAMNQPWQPELVPFGQPKPMQPNAMTLSQLAQERQRRVGVPY